MEETFDGMEFTAHGSDRDEDFQPRDYQDELLDKAYKRNTILFLPTGSGKTYIAVMLIKKCLEEIEQDISEGGKRTVFLVNNVPLVDQQAAYIRRFVPVNVGAYNGSMKVDLWKHATWSRELRKHQVLVMTAEILNQILSHAYISLENINLLIFDECHHAVGDHPMRQIMQYFEMYKHRRHKLPKVLGLTATILNMNTDSHKLDMHIKNLEETFHAAVATVSDYKQVFRYSTNPDSVTEWYNPRALGNKNDIALNNVFGLIIAVQDLARTFQFDLSDTEDVTSIPEARLINNKQEKKNKQLVNHLENLKLCMEMLGIYGGNEAALCYIILMIQKREKAADKNTYLLYSAIITMLIKIRKLLTDVMCNKNDVEKIYLYSSDKVKKLIEILELFKEQWVKAQNVTEWQEMLRKQKSKPCALVFVERRFTAQVVYLIIQALAKHDPNFAFIKPDFMVGCTGYSRQNTTRDLEYENRLSSRAVKRFCLNETNLLVTTDVMEEGIDIPQCTLVVKFDESKNYRSYVQSKGRARHKDSKFVIMGSSNPQKQFKLLQNIEKFNDTEEKLKNILIGHLREVPSIEEIEDSVYDHELPPYQPYGREGPQVNLVGAISLVNRYCMELPHDRYTNLTALWYMNKNENRAYIRLPINSPLRETVEGQIMSTRKQAKRAVALKVCMMLHEMGELDDRLMPKRNVLETSNLHSELLPLWENETATKNKEQPGTKNMQRNYHLKCPSALYDCFPAYDSESYLHVISIKPAYERPYSHENRLLQFYEILNKNNGYALLSTKPLPKICKFSVAMNVGKMNVEIMSNYSLLKLTDAQISSLKRFHNMLFLQVLNMCKSFIPSEEKEYSYLVVPTVGDLCNVSIDWEVINAYNQLPAVKRPNDNDLKKMVFPKERYFHSIVSPWYRGTNSDEYFLVTRVCDELTPDSPFPDVSKFKTYREYFKATYQLSVIHEYQPLLEVKGITQNLNLLFNRRVSSTKRAKMDHDVHLIPEFCVHFSFPSVLWIKGKCIPSILHRITHLLLAEELRSSIANGTGVGATTISNGFEWKHLDAEDDSDTEEVENSGPTDATSKSALFNKLKKVVSLNCAREATINEDNCEDDDEDKEPKDIFRYPHDVTEKDVLYYEEYLKKPLREFQKNVKGKRSLDACSFDEIMESLKRNLPAQNLINSYMKNINILEKEISNGPEISTVLKALTSASAADAFNLERLETLGDSYLKFIIALFLFLRYPLLDEGKLTQIKDKLLGNRNLYYCGKHIGLPEIIKTDNFFPKINWLPPCLMLNPKLRELLDSDEQIDGTSSPSHSFLLKRLINDKTVADSVEALIGAYLQSSGIRGALLLLHWLQVLPKDSASLFDMFDKPASTAKLNPVGDVDLHLKSCDKLEETIGYTFKDRSFLLQALTHPSFTSNLVTDCYQRLEFLGDAVLDFLVTCYIYENCGKLTPGQLTDLRSALVNNVTFASLAVRYGFHRHLQFRSVRLIEIINRFVAFQEENDHQVSEEVLILLEERDTKIAEAIEVPKALGDVFESIAGAIYLDSGKSLSTVWRIYSKLMRKELDEFTKKVPKQAVRMLHELSPNKPKFLESKVLIDQNVTMVPLELFVKGKKEIFFGFGATKRAANHAAAKLALRAFLASSSVS